MTAISYRPVESPLPEARGLWNQGRRDEALELFLKAARTQKGNLAAMLDAARALGASYRVREAERLLLDVRKHVRDLPVLGIHIGQILREIRRPEKALETFEKTLAALPESMEALVEAAQLLERQGRWEDALDHVRRALMLQSDSDLLRLFETRLLALSGRVSEAVGHYRSMIDEPGMSDGLRARAMHELAMLIEADAPEEALRWVTAAHALMLPGTEGLLERGRVSVKTALSLGAELDAAFLARLKSELPARDQRKIVFLLGFARSGTTLVEKLLSAGGGFADAEELDLFGLYVHPLLTGTLGGYLRDDETAREAVEFLRRRYLKGMQEYFGRQVGGWIVDKNPSHTAICASLARVFPEAKFLVVLRDPRDTLLSAFFQYLPPNPESAAFLEWDALVERYVDTMTAWLDLREKLAPDAWKEVRYESFTREPVEHVAELRRWLGEEAGTSVSRVNGHVSSPSHADVRRPVHTGRVERWKRHESLFGDAVRAKLEAVMIRLGYTW